MTPKELLKEIKARHESLYDRYYNTEKYHFNENNKFLYDDLEKALNELEALKKPPTVEEVCKAIQDDVHSEVNYKQEMFYNLVGCTYLSTQNKIKTNQALSPKTLILIGRFYEGLK